MSRLTPVEEVIFYPLQKKGIRLSAVVTNLRLSIAEVLTLSFVARTLTVIPCARNRRGYVGKYGELNYD